MLPLAKMSCVAGRLICLAFIVISPKKSWPFQLDVNVT